jgi:CubicO group peptidase (beta-lactamase class C family)
MVAVVSTRSADCSVVDRVGRDHNSDEGDHMAGNHERRTDPGALADLLGRHAARHGVPGAALGVLRAGEHETACYGVADIRTQRPVAARTPFSLGSLTKPLVATLLVRLAEAGELSLDDTLAARVPEASGIAWAQQVTLRDLMGNRSGVPLTLDLEFGFAARTDEDDEALARFAAEIAAHDPSPRVWTYTNAGWCLLGRAVEAVSGTTFEEAARQHLSIARVRGIAFETEGPVAGRVSGHDVSDDGPVPVPPLVNRAYAAAGTSAAGGVEAMLDFARWHLTDPSLAVLRETTEPRAIPGWFDAWCLGWARFDWSSGPVWGWDGMINGERTLLRLLPDRQSAVVLLANASTGRALARTLLPELIEATFDIQLPAWRSEPSTNIPGDLTPYAGTYAWPDRRIEVTVTEDGLRIAEDQTVAIGRALDARTFVLEPSDPDRPTITFGEFGTDGRAGVLYDCVWGLPRVEQERR